ncbi:MAG: transcriptional repressor [Nitrospira sp.]|nr:transcriptional repressor [Nitrospira sp.]
MPNAPRLKHSRQRDLVIAAFEGRDHVSAQTLYRLLAEQGHRISLGTVYRNMKILCIMGLAEARHFGDRTQYDHSASKGQHDHFLCTRCDHIVEFDEPEIARLRRKVAEANGFSLSQEKLELYGICASCQTPHERRSGNSLQVKRGGS